MATIIICPSCGTRYEIAAVIPPEGRKVRCSKCSHIWQALPIPPMPVTPAAAPPRREEPPSPPPVPAEGSDFASYAPEPQPEPSFSSSFEEVPPSPAEEESGFLPPASNGRDALSYESYAQQDAEFDGGDLAPDQPSEGIGGAPPETAAQTEAEMFGEWDSAAPAEASPMPEIAPVPAPEARSGRSAKLGWLGLLLFVLGLLGFVLMAPKSVVAMLPGATSLYAALGMPINTTGLDFQGVTYGWNQEGEETVLEVKGDIINLTDAPVKLPVVVIVLLDENGKELSQYTTVAREEPVGAGEAAPFLAEIASPPAEVRKLKVRFAKAQ